MGSTSSGIVREQERIIEEFAQFSDWSDRYEYLIDLGKALPPLDDAYKTDLHLVKGCQSRVWLHAAASEGKLLLSADSDTVITKGIVALLIRVLNGQLLTEVEHADFEFLETIGLKSHLSPTRSNGLVSMIGHIKSYAKHLADDGSKIPDDTPDTHQNEMIQQIKQIYDPEIPVDIWELGLIYDLHLDTAGKAIVKMTLTSPACPVAGSLPTEVQERLLELPFVNDVELSLVWDPPWSNERMSDQARMALDMF